MNIKSGFILDARDLRKYFPVTKGILFSKTVSWVRAVDGISFAILPGLTLGLAGESGCGKTTTARIIWLLESITSGLLLYRGRDVTRFSQQELKQYRTRIQAVLQDPYSSLSPRLKVGEIVSEPLIANSTLSRKEIEHRVAEVLERVALPASSANLYPHEFSGGQRQRIAIGRALAIRPELIVLDEPVSALDVSIRAEVMNVLKDLQETEGMSYLLIAHDLATMRYMSHSAAIMYLGEIVELAPTDQLFGEPLHPYTKGLLSAALPSHPDVKRKQIILRGEVASALDPPAGCRFHPRCFHTTANCRNAEPSYREVSDGRWVACHLYGT